MPHFFTSACFALAVTADLERLPEWPACKVACNLTRSIYPDSGNREKVWPLCPRGDGGCTDCTDQVPGCPTMVAAHDGFGCEDNPAFMLSQCISSCNACHLTFEERCGKFARYPPALRPGEIGAMFQRLTTSLGLDVEVLSPDPWLVLVRNIVREDELELLLRDRPMQAASDTGALGADGRATQIFSRNRDTDVHWCWKGCIDDPALIRLATRISEMIRVHPDHFEGPQLLRYKPGQYYHTHHDASTKPLRFVGTRVYTVFIYLSDVEAGGETEFPRLGLKVACGCQLGSRMCLVFATDLAVLRPKPCGRHISRRQRDCDCTAHTSSHACTGET